MDRFNSLRCSFNNFRKKHDLHQQKKGIITKVQSESLLAEWAKNLLLLKFLYIITNCIKGLSSLLPEVHIVSPLRGVWHWIKSSGRVIVFFHALCSRLVPRKGQTMLYPLHTLFIDFKVAMEAHLYQADKTTARAQEITHPRLLTYRRILQDNTLLWRKNMQQKKGPFIWWRQRWFCEQLIRWREWLFCDYLLLFQGVRGAWER